VVSSLILLLALSAPNIDCSKVRFYVHILGERGAIALARKWGATESDIEKGKRCLLKKDS